MNSPVVSIIIPVYNAEKTLQRAIESVIEQTYPQIEFIVVDGRSNDESAMIARRFQRNIHVYINEPDQGIYDAINKGIRHASGEWLYILGADDALASKKTVHAVITSITTDARLIYGNIRNIGAKSSRIPTFHKNKWSKILLWKNTLHQQGVFYHQSIFSNFQFDIQFSVLADYDLHLKLWMEKIAACQYKGEIAHCGATGISKKFSIALYREELRLKRKRLPWIYFLLNIPWIGMKYIYKNV